MLLNQRSKVRDQRLIGWRHRILAQFAWPHPFQLLCLLGHNEAIPASADIERHEQIKVGIKVARKCQWRETIFLHIYSELFFKFANETLLRPFARFDFAAGKFPQTGHRFAGRALRDQHPAVAVDQSAGGDEDKLDGHELLISVIAWVAIIWRTASKKFLGSSCGGLWPICGSRRR